MICKENMFPTRKLEGERSGFSLLESAGYVKTVSPGCIAFLPFGTKTLQKITSVIRQICQEEGFVEISLPLLQKHELWMETGRAEKYASTLSKTMIGGKEFVINPTQEEAVLDLFRSSNFKKGELPLKVFHVGERVRNEARPAHGLIRSRTFILADVYIIEKDKESLAREVKRLERIMEKVLRRIGIPFKKGLNNPSKAETNTYSYWVQSVTRQCNVLVCDNCGSSYREKEDMPACLKCGASFFSIVEAAEIGDIIQSGDSLSTPMNVCPTDSEKCVHVAMAGIGVSRLLQLAAEYQRDNNGLVWSSKLAPFLVHIISSNEREKEAQSLYENLKAAGIEALLDLRKASFGRLFVDADLLGLPMRAVFGKKTNTGTIEVKNRRSGEIIHMSSGELIAILKKEN